MVRLLIIALFLSLALFHGPARAVDGPKPDEPAFPGQMECHVKLPGGGWKPQEKWAWNRICLGKIVNLSWFKDEAQDIAPYECDTKQAKSWPSHSVLSDRFLQLIVRHSRYSRLIQDSGVRIRCAKYENWINLSNARLDWPIGLHGSVFERGVDISDLVSVSTLSFVRSTFDGPFNAIRLEAGGGLFMSGKASFQAVNLFGAKVGGDLAIAGSTFEGLFNADGLEVGGHLFMDGEASFQAVNLLGVKVGGDLAIAGSTFEGLFNADGLEVGGHLFMIDEASFKAVDLLGAKVGGDLAIAGSTFEGLFDASGSEIGGYIFLRDKASFRDVGLINVKAGGSLQIYGSRFIGHLDATGMSIKSELHLASFGRSPPTWDDGARLTLRNVHVGALQDTKEAWNLKEGALDLDGFSYDRLGGLRSEKGSSMASRKKDWLMGNWLAKQRDYNTVFQPQPFRQLAKVLRVSGHTHKADDILYAMREHQRTLPSTSISEKIPLYASWALLGYGYTVWRAGIWFFGLVLLGASIAGMAPVRRGHGYWHRFFFSLESAVPLIDLSPLNERYALQLTPGVDRYFHFHKIAGLVLVSVLVAGMTGLVS
jgi:hypothetical protein